MTSGRVLKRFSFISVFVAGSFCMAGDEEPLLQQRGVTARNQHFEVIAADMLSAHYAATVGDMLASRFSRMLPPPTRISQPVLVDLVPETKFANPEPFATRIYSSGQVKVVLSWGETTTRDNLERALAQGHLTYLSGAYSPGRVTVPLWLELATQHLARAEAIPTHTRSLALKTANKRPMRLEQIFSASRGDGLDEELAPYAYWLLTFLEREGRGSRLQGFLARLLKGEPAFNALSAVYGAEVRSMSEAETWWLVGFAELAASQASPVNSPAESRRRIKELSRFAVTGDDGARTVLFAEDLWQNRESATLQDELGRRRLLVTIEMATVHPFYHNVLVSLDRLFEAILAADLEHYNEALIDWRHDLRTGDELSEDTSSILDDLAAELGG